MHDANGNTLGGLLSQPSTTGTNGTDTYDSQNRLIRRVGTINGRPSTIAITYNGDGHKVREAVTTGGVTTATTYLIDEVNPTGYAQVVEEHTNGTLTRVYTYGHDLISMDQLDGTGAGWRLTYYGYDGHGNVRFLTDEQGEITDTYTYDAFGELLSSIGTTENPYRYAGEQFDAALGLYYLRARTMNPLTGRFWTMDSYEGQGNDPASLHKYLYANADGVNGIDPSGYMTLASVSAGAAIASGIRLEGLALTLQQGSVAYAKASALQIHGKLRSAALDAILEGDFEKADGLLSWAYLVSASLSASEDFNDIVQTAVGTGALYTLIRALPAALKSAPKVTALLKDLPRLLSRGENAANKGGLLGEANWVIGRTAKLATPGTFRMGERSLSFDIVRRSDGTIDKRATWYNNHRALRTAIRDGRPIRDASPGNLGGQFLNGERMQLEYRAWTQQTTDGNTWWIPPSS